MRLYYLAALLIWATACQQKSGEQQNTPAADTTAHAQADAPGLVVDCQHFGPVDYNDSPDDLARKFGAENLRTDSAFAEGSFVTLYTTLWPGQPKQLEIYWVEDMPPFKHISRIETAMPESPYHLPNGIRVGSTLDELTQLNGQPITFSGFGWDFGGIIQQFNGGNIATAYPCFGGVLDVADPEAFNADDGAQVSGDQELRSDAEVFKRVKVTLQRFAINTPHVQKPTP